MNDLSETLRIAQNSANRALRYCKQTNNRELEEELKILSALLHRTVLKATNLETLVHLGYTKNFRL